MNPFIAKPDEIIKGLGYDFTVKFAAGEVLSGAPTVTADTGLTISNPSFSGAIALADVTIPANAQDATLNVYFTAFGNMGSKRKGYRVIWVRAAGE